MLLLVISVLFSESFAASVSFSGLVQDEKNRTRNIMNKQHFSLSAMFADLFKEFLLEIMYSAVKRFTYLVNSIIDQADFYRKLNECFKTLSILNA